MDDKRDLQFLDDALEEMGMTLAEFRQRWPHVCLDERGDGGRTVIDRNELQD